MIPCAPRRPVQAMGRPTPPCPDATTQSGESFASDATMRAGGSGRPLGDDRPRWATPAHSFKQRGDDQIAPLANQVGTLMPSLAFLAPAISLALCLIPVFLLRRKAYARAAGLLRLVRSYAAGRHPEFIHRLCTENGDFRTFFRLGRQRRSLARDHRLGFLRIGFVSHIRPASPDAGVSRQRIERRPIHHDQRVRRTAARRRSRGAAARVGPDGIRAHRSHRLRDDRGSDRIETGPVG